MTYEHTTTRSKETVAQEIEEWVDDARALAREIGLDPYPVNYWIVSNEEMNELITYNGFQERYPHWRFGMQYDQQRKKSQYTGGKAFEIVNNDNPAHAFLQRSNTMADQKAVVTHVEAHADFFKNNRWFDDDPNAAHMLEQHGKRIEEIMNRPDVDRTDVESLIDTATCIEDTIDQHRIQRSVEDEDGNTIEDHIENIDVSDSVKEHVFDDEWMENIDDEEERTFYDDVLSFIIEGGGRYDEDDGKRVDFEDWEREVLEIIRDEAYYFAPQKMTKVMNEGWASFWETIMMADEGFVGDDEIVDYADHHSKVLEAPGLNPYALGREIWEYIESDTNRREVAEKLLCVEGITPGTFHSEIDFDRVEELLNQPDSYSASVRNFSLVRPQNRGYLRNIDRESLEDIWRYMVGRDRYESIEKAIDDVDFEAGWKRMREVRETHIDATFIDQFVTDEFIERNNYFAYDFNPSAQQYQVSSVDPAEVKKKLLLQFTNFGKPTIVAEDGNYLNSGELLLVHQYNGISLDLEQAREVLKRLFDVWGKPVNIRTVNRAGDEEHVTHIRYEGDQFIEDELDGETYDYVLADDIDYDVRPDEWL